ncbi:BA14K family protein [Sinorhizobium meliloti]|nr:BA14K family protein [Sinorhizobium meliloti]MDW9976812.1 BA14K family protein [Sinorhizobium meliloti]MDX0293534.1 BA14K family protein [Sinorhizobium meliloti]
MKTALAVFGGFVLSLALFLSGAVVAVLFLTGKPARQPQLDVNQSEVWTKQPRAVDRTAQQFERLPARPAPSDVNASREPETPAMANEAEKERSPEPLDRMATASIQSPPAEEEPTASTVPAAHADWCARRYRSYRPFDNTYRSFSGGRRSCNSPYMDAAWGPSEDPSPVPRGIDAEDADDPSTQMEYSAGDGEAIRLTQEHVAYCFSRYRSYRPEDNSYQPYSGGPRRQCR